MKPNCCGLIIIISVAYSEKLVTVWIKIYKTLIRPVITYGGETWTLIHCGGEHETLGRFERKIIIRVYGPAKKMTNEK